MNIIFSILLVFFIILLLNPLSIRLDGKEKVKLVNTVIEKVSSLIDSKMALITNQYKSGPWHLVVYTQDSNYPIWISNNTIRSVHPDPEHCKIIIKQFNGEDMVIENVINYEMCSANDLCEYDMY